MPELDHLLVYIQLGLNQQSIEVLAYHVRGIHKSQVQSQPGANQQSNGTRPCGLALPFHINSEVLISCKEHWNYAIFWKIDSTVNQIKKVSKTWANIACCLTLVDLRSTKKNVQSSPSPLSLSIWQEGEKGGWEKEGDVWGGRLYNMHSHKIWCIWKKAIFMKLTCTTNTFQQSIYPHLEPHVNLFLFSGWCIFPICVTNEQLGGVMSTLHLENSKESFLQPCLDCLWLVLPSTAVSTVSKSKDTASSMSVLKDAPAPLHKQVKCTLTRGGETLPSESKMAQRMCF